MIFTSVKVGKAESGIYKMGEASLTEYSKRKPTGFSEQKEFKKLVLPYFTNCPSIVLSVSKSYRISNSLYRYSV